MKMKEEDDRLDVYGLQSGTKHRLHLVMDEELLGVYVQKVLDDDISGLPWMLEHEKKDRE